MGNSLEKSIDGDLIFAYTRVSAHSNASSTIATMSSLIANDERFFNSRSPQVEENSEASFFTDKKNFSRKKKGSIKPIFFSSLPSYVHLGMCSRGVVRLSPQIGFLGSKLETLQLCCNRLKEIPPEIGYLSRLTVLSLGNNKLVELPEAIGFLHSLVELRVPDNFLVKVPRSIVALKKLVLLSLENNRICELPQEIGFLERLVTLNLSNNPIQKLPAELNRLQYLRYLSLQNCPLLDVDEWPMEIERASPCYRPVLSLKEICARTIIRNDLQVSTRISPMLQEYLFSVNECSFCGGPFFEIFFVRGRKLSKGDLTIPLEYKLCENHWSNEQERLSRLFQRRPSTSPSGTKGPHFTSILFNPYKEKSWEESTPGRARSKSFANINLMQQFSRRPSTLSVKEPLAKSNSSRGGGRPRSFSVPNIILSNSKFKSSSSSSPTKVQSIYNRKGSFGNSNVYTPEVEEDQVSLVPLMSLVEPATLPRLDSIKEIAGSPSGLDEIGQQQFKRRFSSSAILTFKKKINWRWSSTNGTRRRSNSAALLSGNEYGTRFPSIL